MLKRKATNFMKNWINTKDKKCLVVQGARQTGKTYTVERFAEENYEELVEINFKQMLWLWVCGSASLKRKLFLEKH